MCNGDYFNSWITTPVFSQNPQQFHDTFSNSRTFHITGGPRRHWNIFVEIWNIFWCIFKSTTEGTTEYCKSELQLCIFIKKKSYRPAGPYSLRKLKLPEFINNQHMKVEKFSALGTGHLYLYDTSLVLISVTGTVDPRDALWSEGINK